MKKLLLSIAMLFSVAMHSHDLSDKLRGAWSSENTSYYVVILHNENNGYELVNFSFAENQDHRDSRQLQTDLEDQLRSHRPVLLLAHQLHMKKDALHRHFAPYYCYIKQRKVR